MRPCILLNLLSLSSAARRTPSFARGPPLRGIGSADRTLARFASPPRTKASGTTWFGGRVNLLLPAHLLSLILLVQPLLQRGEVFEQRAAVRLPFTGQDFQRVGPGFALAHSEHLVELRSGFLRPVESATVERAFVAGLAAEGTVELEFQDVRQEVAGVGHVGRDVIFRSRIEIGFTARCRRRYSLILQPQFPP